MRESKVGVKFKTACVARFMPVVGTEGARGASAPPCFSGEICKNLPKVCFFFIVHRLILEPCYGPEIAYKKQYSII